MNKIKSILAATVLSAAMTANAETAYLVCNPYVGEDKIGTMQVEVIHNGQAVTNSIPYSLDGDGDVMLLNLDGYERGKYTFRVRYEGWAEWGELVVVKKGKPDVRVK